MAAGRADDSVGSAAARRGRREKGEGSISFDSNAGAWIGRLDLGTNPAGKRVRVKVRGRSRAEVRVKLDHLRRERESGIDLSARGMTFDALAALWLERGLPAQTSDLTRANYATLIRSRLNPELGTTKLVDLRSDHVEAVLDNMAQAGYSARTMRLTLNLAQRILQFGQARDLVIRNVASVVVSPRGPVNERKGLTVHQAQALIVALRSEPLGGYFLTMLLLGLRPGEAAALQWRDIDLDTDPPLLRVAGSLRRTSKGMELAPTKTPTSRRILALPNPVVDVLRRQQRVRLAGGARPGLDLVFTNESGQPLDPSNARRALARVGTSTGISGLHPHALRHATASLLSAAGVRVEDIADTLGHRSITVTADVYRHNISPVRLAHVAPLEALIDGSLE